LIIVNKFRKKSRRSLIKKYIGQQKFSEEIYGFCRKKTQRTI
jgi:hypothetical protein